MQQLSFARSDQAASMPACERRLHSQSGQFYVRFSEDSVAAGTVPRGAVRCARALRSVTPATRDSVPSFLRRRLLNAYHGRPKVS